MPQQQLTLEINAAIDTAVTKGLIINAQWITHAVCSKHHDGLAGNAHADFWRSAGYLFCRDEVRRCINRRFGDKEEPDDRQGNLLEGFMHVQQYYVVRRGGDDVGVPAGDMSDKEIDAKALVYESMGRACFSHANELRRFKARRKRASKRAA